MLDDPRAIAARTVAAVATLGKSFNGDPLTESAPLSMRDQAFFRELTYGTLRFYHALNAQLTARLKKPLGKADLDIYCLLLIGIYQLIYLRTPDHAAISATVNSARALGKEWACGLVNGILRNVQRNPQTDIRSLSAQLSHPEWLIKQLQRDWPSHWESIIHCNNQTPSMALRVNRHHQDRDNYLQLLSSNDAIPEARPSKHASQGIRLTQTIDPQLIPGFSEGQVSIQDSGAQLAAELFELPDTALRILDACAAPGGKTSHLLELYPKAMMQALDIDDTRLKRTAATLERLNLSASLSCADASKPAQWWDGKPYQAILLDAPCSGSGVIRKHPDIKLLRKKRDIAKFAEQQYRLLSALWPLLDESGVLIYCTCSVLRAENEEVIERFLVGQADAEHQQIVAEWGQACTVGRQLLPTDNGNDGFFYARLIKRAQV